MGYEVVSVTALNKYVKSLLASDRILNGLMVRGEISNFTRHYRSGHLYFTLKDSEAAVKCVMFRSNASQIRFDLQDGMGVIISGSVSLYERDGSYQFYVTDIQPDGVGALHLAFEQLKAKLSAEGLFDECRKRPLPRYPQRIGIVTSEGAAALADMLQIFSRRYPLAHILISPAQVQGPEAPSQLCAAMDRLYPQDCDVIIIGRGGGSMEDLWAFNDEGLARTIAGSPVPVVSAVGHETDFTIADFAADLRAPTPSAAAELTAPNVIDIRYELMRASQRCDSLLGMRCTQVSERLAMLSRSIKNPSETLAGYVRTVEQSKLAIRRQMLHKIERCRANIAYQGQLIEAKSPMTLLSRGYSITTQNGKSVRSVAQVNPEQRISTRIFDGELLCSVIECKEIKNDGQTGDA